MLEDSFRQLASWISKDLWNVQHRLSINISSRQFQNKKLSIGLINLLEKTEVPAHCIDIEITEDSIISDVKKAVDKMEQLIEKGITFSLDDFGTGYSSLGYLKMLPVTTLKIDRSFIDDITENESDRALVTLILAISKNMGLKTVAEGIETQEQMLMLKNFQCELLQGYYFSKPLAAEEFVKYLI